MTTHLVLKINVTSNVTKQHRITTSWTFIFSYSFEDFSPEFQNEAWGNELQIIPSQPDMSWKTTRIGFIKSIAKKCIWLVWNWFWTRLHSNCGNNLNTKTLRYNIFSDHLFVGLKKLSWQQVFPLLKLFASVNMFYAANWCKE